MVTLRRKRRSSTFTSASSMEVERDPSAIPGKPFLEHLHRVLDTSSSAEKVKVGAPTESGVRTRRLTSTRRLFTTHQDGSSTRPLVVDAACLCYLQQLFRAMLTPTTSPHSALTTQWRLNAAFTQQLSADPQGAEVSNLGVASPERILQLAGRLLEVDALHITTSLSDVALSAPSDCDLALFPKLTRLHLTGVDLRSIHGLVHIASSLTQLRYSSQSIDSLASLLLLDDPCATWRNLRSLCVDNAQLRTIDTALATRAPNLETVVFSNNQLQHLGDLASCQWLSAVDLSHNQIHSLTIVEGTLERVRVLNLSHNSISSLDGLRHLRLVEVLDLSHNRIMALDQIQTLAPLQRLHSLGLVGNPVSTAPAYRQFIRSHLSGVVLLDDLPWDCQDLNVFAGDQESTAPSTERPTSQDVAHDPHTAVQQKPMPIDAWWIVRGVVCSCLVIGFAQVVVSTVWSRDPEAEQLTLWLVCAMVVLGGVSLLVSVVASWLCNAWLFRSTGFTASHSLTGENRCVKKPSIRSLSRAFSCNFDTATQAALLTDSLSAFQLEEFAVALDEAVYAGDDVDLNHLVHVCRYLKICLANWSSCDGSGCGFAWRRLDRAVATFQLGTTLIDDAELVRDRLSSTVTRTLDASQSSQSSATALAKVVPVIRLCGIVLSSLREDSSLPQVLCHAYVEVFASQHSWWRQRAVEASITNKAPTTEAVLEWLRSTESPSHDQQRLLAVIRQCGERLGLLHDTLRDLVDEHEHSFRAG